MKGHPYLRAYMAGVLLPTWVLMLWLGALLTGHWTGGIPARLESALVFPMAVVPNLWGLWNLLYAWLGLHRRLSLGAFGALLPVILVPAGVGLASAFHLDFFSARQAAVFLPLLMAIYYLAWKYAVTFFNRIVDLR
jgi:hypothetical protein